ncbi:hypothetical protein [uncultured Kocuria sp.]|uniref:hypothetical protein n=1 Tax=uncultured Kocuria sp. TaxID=259305 RepID=UPI00260743E6|nr:hypothetical protein [uncultured Kocuria sp.]
MTARRLAIIRRTTLEMIPGWDADCYVEWRHVTYAEAKEMATPDDDAEAMKAIAAVTKEHIIGGKIKVLGDNNKIELVDYTPDDFDSFPASVIRRLFVEITGAQYDDPKDMAKDQTSSDEPTTQENDTATS